MVKMALVDVGYSNLKLKTEQRTWIPATNRSLTSFTNVGPLGLFSGITMKRADGLEIL
jgi:hypothetical protein